MLNDNPKIGDFYKHIQTVNEQAKGEE